MKEKEPSFEQAINASMIWCQSWDNEEISDEVLAERIGELLNTQNGARGFFVTSLSSDSPLMDRIPDALIFELRKAGKIVVDLTIKNLAMSTAMSIYHTRNNSETQSFKSDRIKNRCIELLKLLESSLVKILLESLLEGTIDGEGDYKDFLNRWNYDKEQKAAIERSIYKVSNK